LDADVGSASTKKGEYTNGTSDYESTVAENGEAKKDWN